MANILLAVTGSIASYKSADLVSSLKKQGHQVTVLMTQAATEFIQPLTLQVLSQNPVHLDVMKEPYPDQVNHIELGKKADLFIVVPATANTIAKLAHGFGGQHGNQYSSSPTKSYSQTNNSCYEYKNV
ncbi:flavoprotein involved in panthothenate metabolism [Streptococcus pneumoniae]|nr:flavoprotein involved in panthothenate metabolism [Streptococcus pneumoniae]